MAINLTNPFGMVTIQPNIGPITPVMPAPTNIPNLTGFGDRLATIGGFGDDPNELKTQEELEKMTQAEIDAYVKKRKQARRLGLSESLITIGEAFQGKDATTNAIARAQARQNQQSRKNLQKQYEEAVAIAEKTDPDKATLLKNLGLAGYANVNQKIAENLLLPAKPSGQLLQVVDENGNFVANMTREEAIQNAADFSKRGFRFTNLPTGTDPAPTRTKTTIDPIKEQFIQSEKLIKGLSDTAKIIFDNPESANKLVAGGASAYTFIISNISGLQSLIDNNKDTKAYKDLQRASVSLEGNDYAQKIKDVALASNISESRIKDLAFAFAAARGQTGRGLSDRDFQNALDILSKGVNAEQKIALFADVARRIQSDYQIVSDLAKRLNSNNPDIVNQINAIGSLSSFVSPYTQPSTTQTSSNIEDILKKYPPKG